MENENAKSLEFISYTILQDEKILKYVESKGNKAFSISISLPLRGRPVKTDKLVFENKYFVNGFKVVKTKNGEYGYIRKEDNVLLPYRYDVATDFNKYGFAMIGKDGYVTWINKNFEYLDSYGQMTKEQEGIPFKAWKEVNDFSKGEIPLSLICKRWYNTDAYCYMDTFGKIKSFVEYKRCVGSNYPIQTTFSSCTPFNDQGYAKSENYILNSKGYMIDKNDLVKICFKNGFVDSVFEEIDQKVTDYGRTLKK